FRFVILVRRCRFTLGCWRRSYDHRKPSWGLYYVAVHRIRHIRPARYCSHQSFNFAIAPGKGVMIMPIRSFAAALLLATVATTGSVMAQPEQPAKAQHAA